VKFLADFLLMNSDTNSEYRVSSVKSTFYDTILYFSLKGFSSIISY